MRFKLLLVILLITAINMITLADSNIVNYDTAWTFVYDGGKANSGRNIYDYLFDVKASSDGCTFCIGETRDTSEMRNVLLIKLSPEGKVLLKRLYRFEEGGGGSSIIRAKNGDLIIGGYRYGDPLLMRTDSIGNIKWSTWYYDSLKSKSILLQSATINSLRETSSGRIICAIGEDFPGPAVDPLDNYAAYLEFDSLGTMTNWGEWWEEVGYKISGFSIEELSEDRYVIAGNQAVIGINIAGTKTWQNSYSFWLDGVGTVTNNVTRVKKLRDGTLMVIGQAYEANCWTSYQRLSYDAWWSPISSAGTNAAWDTTGRQGGDDKLYDFTQLNDGKIVLVGKRSSVTDAGGAWTIVTDSTGENILWQKMTKIMYGTDESGKAVTPYSVCATPDNGFTIAGLYNCTEENGGPNGFVAHFIPKEITGINSISATLTNNFNVQSMAKGSRVIFNVNTDSPSPTEITIFNAAGKTIKTLLLKNNGGDNNSLSWNCTTIAKGLYFYRIKTIKNSFTGKITIGM